MTLVMTVVLLDLLRLFSPSAYGLTLQLERKSECVASADERPESTGEPYRCRSGHAQKSAEHPRLPTEVVAGDSENL